MNSKHFGRDDRRGRRKGQYGPRSIPMRQSVNHPVECPACGQYFYSSKGSNPDANYRKHYREVHAR
jgi:hypothetical protein